MAAIYFERKWWQAVYSLWSRTGPGTNSITEPRDWSGKAARVSGTQSPVGPGLEVRTVDCLSHWTVTVSAKFLNAFTDFCFVSLNTSRFDRRDLLNTNCSKTEMNGTLHKSSEYLFRMILKHRAGNKIFV